MHAVQGHMAWHCQIGRSEVEYKVIYWELCTDLMEVGEAGVSGASVRDDSILAPGLGSATLAGRLDTGSGLVVWGKTVQKQNYQLAKFTQGLRGWLAFLTELIKQTSRVWKAGLSLNRRADCRWWAAGASAVSSVTTSISGFQSRGRRRAEHRRQHKNKIPPSTPEWTKEQKLHPHTQTEPKVRITRDIFHSQTKLPTPRLSSLSGWPGKPSFPGGPWKSCSVVAHGQHGGGGDRSSGAPRCQQGGDRSSWAPVVHQKALSP